MKQILEKNVLLLDGAMGTMIQKCQLSESDFRGDHFESHPVRLSGCNDLLCLTRPDVIKGIHKEYLDAGADIISTNSFNANAISLADYSLEKIPGLIKEINKHAAAIARAAADEAQDRSYGGKALVAGSIGPTNRAASMSPDVADPAFRNVTFDELVEAYSQQIEGLIEGGVDILLFETVFDTLNLKAGLDAANKVMQSKGIDLPVMVSATVAGKDRRTLSGQTLAAFATSVEDFPNIVSLGLNCSFGPSDMLPLIKELGVTTSRFISCHPNAGLPNALGEYDVTPEEFALQLAPILEGRLVNIIGGCCGTTPKHISALHDILDRSLVHLPVKLEDALRISGLERVEMLPENNFLNVGERCNVAGSRKFLRLIKEKKYDEAVAIAAKQVEDGAMMIDINMDDALLDAKTEMVHFLRCMASDPDVAKVPVMIDSSDWEVVEAALKNIQGKSIVNSISLKEGEEAFLKKAKRIRELGSAVIVMAFDENGQADTYEKKIAVSKRAYDLLVEKCGYRTDDIIFDVNIMAVATGMEEHFRYGADFIDAVAWIKRNLPGARTSGGVSNLSFAFRGKNSLREAMHSVFLYHAISSGLDMAIMNPASSVSYDEIEPGLRTLIEDVVLARRREAPEELAAYASEENAESVDKTQVAVNRHDIPVEDRLTEAIIKGHAEFLVEDLKECLGHTSAVGIIEGPLMQGMDRVGEMFSSGKMFLPQVVKTARTMKMAVDMLRPYFETEPGNEAAKAGKVLFATVKGDVHDIGKNIVSIVMACNNYEVIDLGVMVPAERIVEVAKKEKPDFICLSGLITPSLAEMVGVAEALQEAGISTPLMVGGATTSKLHTALKISPVYDGPVIHVTDAAQNPLIASRLMSGGRDSYLEQLETEYESLRKAYSNKTHALLPLEEARQRGAANKKKREAAEPFVPGEPPMPSGLMKIIDVDITKIAGLINWKMFFNAWKLTGSFLIGFPYDGCTGCIETWRRGVKHDEMEKAEEALKLYDDAKSVIAEIVSSGSYDGKAALAFYPAESSGDDIEICGLRFPMLRQQRENSDFLCLSDYVMKDDYVGTFVATAGNFMHEMAGKLKNDGDDYKSLLYQSLADRLAEATSEWLHRNYSGIRPAFGYPMLPDQLLNNELAKLLPMTDLGVSVTENGAMMPSSTVSGLFILNPSSKYFMVGEIGDDQFADYSKRRGLSETEMHQILK